VLELIAVNKEKAKIKTGGGETAVDRNFTFIAIGD
jgi:hypothetical protein